MRNNELEQAKTLQDLNEELLALKLRMAFQAEFEEELADLERAEHDPEFEAMLADAEPRMLRRIDKELRREQLRHTVRTVVPRVARACAMFLLVFYLGLTVAVATMEPVRVGVVDFIQNITDQYMLFDIESKTVSIPPAWEGEYFPAYVPKELKITYIDSNSVWFGDNWELNFCELDNATDINADTEVAETKHVLINGYNGILIEKDGWIKIVWEQNDKYFYLNGRCNENKLRRIAESVIQIEK